ncbi:hypothetical protein IFM89_009936 [Coptis chinensis]|uniref:Uncharacterized protein n=1 Tax=Coptis chinensis TaxID=261450 RepID=A0A835LPW6_9MAGN|nr:hypothetical protein IFM89_009936 [Coptis chinensis]
MASNEQKKIVKLNVMVHRKLNQVVFAEADKDFVDILFSFLTIPLGTIVRLLRKQSHPTVIGSLNNLHSSVENLEKRRFQKEICKTMLLRTRNAYGDECRKLELNIDDTEPTSFYLCQPCASRRIGASLLSTFDSSSCGSRLTPMTLRSRPNGSEVDGEDGVFVKGNATFLVTDDLQVTPLSTLATFRLLNNLGITDAVLLEKKSLDVDFEQVMKSRCCQIT